MIWRFQGRSGWRGMRRTGAMGLLPLSMGAALAAGSATLTLEGTGPYYRLQLPASIYTLSADQDLNDLRLRNGAGAPLAWAWNQAEQQTPVMRTRPVPLFPVPAKGAAAGPDAFDLRLRADGSVMWRKAPPAKPQKADWILDVHQAKGSLLKLRLKMAPQSIGVFPLDLEASDDLRQWHPVASQTAVMQLAHQGQQLLQDELDLGGMQARYLRLRWAEPDQSPALLSAELDSFDEVVPSAPPLQWTESWSPDRCDATRCTWVLPAHVPLDAVRVTLAEPQTVARLRVVGENPVSGGAQPARHRRHLHPLHPWRALTRSERVEAPDSYRTTLADTVVWRLPVAGGGESTNPEVMLDGEVYATLHLQADHAVSEWGQAPPKLALGTRTRSLTLLARGPAPYVLSWGNASTEGAPVSQATLMPLGAPTNWGTARVDLPAIARPTPAAAAPETDRAAGASAATATAEHKWWLWATLIAGLLLLGLMAASLLKKTATQSTGDPS